MDVVKETTSNLAKFGSQAGGLVLGSIVMKKVGEVLPASLPAIAQKIIPGALGMVLAFFLNKKFGNQYVKNAAMGLGLAGFVDVLKKVTADIPALQQVSTALPTLSGLGRIGYVQNYGDYPPNYFLDSNRQLSRALSGPNETAYNLMGANPNALQGWMQW